MSEKKKQKKTSDRLVGQDGYLKQQFIESCLEKKHNKLLGVNFLQ